MMYLMLLFFFKQKTAYEMRISDWSSDVCSSDLAEASAWLSRAWAADRLWPCRSMVMSGVRFPLRILRSQPESRVAAGVRGWAVATVRAEGTVNPVFSLAGTGTVGMAETRAPDRKSVV